MRTNIVQYNSFISMLEEIILLLSSYKMLKLLAYIFKNDVSRYYDTFDMIHRYS